MSLIVVDINAHHSRWDTDTNKDERGEQLADEIDIHDYNILSENEATRQSTNSRTTAPDIRLDSSDIALPSDWSVSTQLTSNHMPIPITVNFGPSEIDAPRRTYINFTKADWAHFCKVCDEYHAEAGKAGTVEQVEKNLMKAVNKASGVLIPA